MTPEERERLHNKANEMLAIHQERICPTKTPEPHLAGEFPMTCYACHMVADS